MPQLLENAFVASAAELKNKKNLAKYFLPVPQQTDLFDYSLKHKDCEKLHSSCQRSLR